MVMQVTRKIRCYKIQRERARQQRAALWATRDNVQRHALSMSMPWLAFVNIAFALMIFFRNFIFTYFDKRLLTHRAVIPYIEAALIAVILSFRPF